MQCFPTPCESSANSCDPVYMPQVKSELIPIIGQNFDTLDDVHQFYNAYAKDGGFGTRKDSTKKNRDGEVTRKEFVCCKQGLRQEKKTDKAKEPTTDTNCTQESKTRRSSLTREGCLAKLVVLKDGKLGHGYVVSQFVEGHNHPLLTPRKIHVL